MKKNLILSLSCVLALSAVSVVVAMPGKNAETSVVEKASQPENSLLSGKILQTMDSGGYSYAYIQKKDGEKIWVACPTTELALGTQVSFKGGMEMRDFESKSLKRKFEKIYFADSAVVGKDGGGMPKDHGKNVSVGSKGATGAKDAKISVTKATGANAHTIQEIYANSAKLNKKKVVVRGKVVKVSVGIMGKNWIHLQDGTGSQTKKTHNLVFTSQEMADVDDVVTLSGTLAKDKDFGGGYKYEAIVEEATVKK